MWLPFVWEAILNLRTLKWFPQVKCPPDPHGVSRPPGSKEDTAAKGGILYVRWDHESCPDGGAQLVYAGRAGGSYYDHKGGGGNPQCLPLDPNFYKTVSGAQSWAFMYGAEYEQTNPLVANSHNNDIPCAVCYVPMYYKCSLYGTS